MLAIAAIFALALPTLAMVEEEHPGGAPHPQARPAPPHPAGPPPGARPAVVPHGPPPGPRGPPPGPHGPMVSPHPGPGPAVVGPHPGPGPAVVGPHGPVYGPGQFSFRGHDFNRVHINPYVYPQGWAYRQWAVGAILPPLFLVPDYYYPEWAALGLEPPPPGFQWMRYGPDLLLVNVVTGQVADVAYGVFYD